MRDGQHKTQNNISSAADKLFFTVAQAACFLGMDQDVIHRLIQAGSLGGLRFNQQWCLARQEVYAWKGKPSRR